MAHVLLSALICVTFGAEPNPPNWPSNVYIFNPGNDSYTQSIVDKVFGGSARTLIHTLAGHESLTEAEQAEVRRLLDQLGDRPSESDG